MTEMQLEGSPESLIESIRFTRMRDQCENGGNHDWWSIVSHGQASSVWWCDHPLCDQTPWRWSTSPVYVLLTQWVPISFPTATAYLLVISPPGELPHVEARVGIRSQWRDPQWGNVGTDGEHGLLAQRYFAESGPGVYPATIETTGEHRG